LIPGGPFADDADLARFLLQRLDDEIAYLGRSAERAGLRSAAMPPLIAPAAAPVAPAPVAAEPVEDIRRNVFVVYGRDESARRAVFEFLRAIGLRPLEWETLVRETGKSAPSLAEAVRQGLAMSRAVVVLMTPEDVVRLHPELHEPHETRAETEKALQSRPNVLLELGMALTAHPNGTLVLMVGEHRPVTDLGGINFIRLTDTADCRRKIAGRLEQAGCLVDDSGQDWLSAGDFGSLTAHHRSP
jgi:predicted nucleotide-binding protein